MAVGKRIRLARKAKGLNQGELANKLGVSLDTISRWETEKRQPRSDDLANLSQVLNISIAYLMGIWDTMEPLGAEDIQILRLPEELKHELENEAHRKPGLEISPEPPIMPTPRTPAKIIESIAALNGALTETAGLFTDDEVRAAESLLHLCLKNFEAEPEAIQKQETALEKTIDMRKAKDR